MCYRRTWYRLADGSGTQGHTFLFRLKFPSFKKSFFQTFHPSHRLRLGFSFLLLIYQRSLKPISISAPHPRPYESSPLPFFRLYAIKRESTITGNNSRCTNILRRDYLKDDERTKWQLLLFLKPQSSNCHRILLKGGTRR